MRDGRAYLNAVDTRYDVIMVDAYQDITIPFHMSSAEFFTLLRDRLIRDEVAYYKYIYEQAGIQGVIGAL